MKATLIAGLLLASAGLANAAEPVALSASDMEHVTAGSAAGAWALSLTLGNAITQTQSFTATATNLNYAGAEAATIGIANSVPLASTGNYASSVGASHATATLP